MEWEEVRLEARDVRGKENTKLLFPRQEGRSMVTVGNAASSNKGLGAGTSWSQAFTAPRGKDFRSRIAYPAKPSVNTSTSNHRKLPEDMLFKNEGVSQ